MCYNALCCYQPVLPVRVSRPQHFSRSGMQTPRCSVSDRRPFSRAISWNVNSLPRLLRKNPRALRELVDDFDPDLICLQGTMTRSQHEHLLEDILPDYKLKIFNSSITRLGRRGTAMLSKRNFDYIQRNIRDDPCDREGQYLEARFPSVIITTVQCFSSGTNFQRLDKRLSWESALRQQIRELRFLDGYPVILIGDLGVARRDEDVYDPESLSSSPGFSDDERQSFEDTIESCGLVDAYRMFHPGEKGRYTYWDPHTNAREANHGIRRDYALVTEDMVDAVHGVHILDQVQGSDHCPIAIDLKPGLI